MRKHLLLSFVPMTLVLSAAGPPAPACADEGMRPDRAMLVAEPVPSMQLGDGFSIVIVTVSAPQPLPAAQASVTLWDEIPPPPQLPMPLPAPQPSDMRHAMGGNARGSTHP
ncbi:hypothetical protein [Burkholderia cenocepacia]|uniref:hypothetical protein n=1 Tax=Burkholderia cenocepacia TaxID=95486 RepID=UPI000665D3BC|nr:hypothetical protein [Burkholderia cenocepacia]